MLEFGTVVVDLATPTDWTVVLVLKVVEDGARFSRLSLKTRGEAKPSKALSRPDSVSGTEEATLLFVTKETVDVVVTLVVTVAKCVSFYLIFATRTTCLPRVIL